MSKCCGDPPAPLINYVKTDKACKVNSGALKIFNSYTLNKQQEMKKNNTIDFSNSKLTKAFGKDAVRIKAVLHNILELTLNL